MTNADELARSYSFEIRPNQYTLESMETRTPTVRYPTSYRPEIALEKPHRSSSVNALMNSAMIESENSLANRKVTEIQPYSYVVHNQRCNRSSLSNFTDSFEGYYRN